MILGVFLAWTLAATLAVCVGWAPAREWAWIDLLLPGLGGLATLASLGRRLPLQNLIAIGSLILLLTTILLVCGARSQLPFGPIRYPEKADPWWFYQVPPALPLWWLAILVCSRETARLILGPWQHTRNHGFWVVSLAAGLVVITDANWEPFAVQVRRLWQWEATGPAIAWYSAPWTNFVGWFASGLILLGLLTPWFIAKRPVQPRPGCEPALIWSALNLHFIAGNAAGKLWPAALIGSAFVAVAALASWWSLRRSAERG